MSGRDDYLMRLQEADTHIAEAERAVTEQMAQVQASRGKRYSGSGARTDGLPGDPLPSCKIIAPASIKQSNNSTAVAEDRIFKQHGALSTR
jgi:hypothetical protein